MRRPPAALSTVAIALCVSVGLGGCAGTKAAEPTAATVNFAPKTVLAVDEAGITSVPLEVIDGAVSLQAGNVIEVANTGTTERRVTGAGIDTGIMRPGDTTTVVVSKAGEVSVVDVYEPSHHLILRVAPRD